MSNVQINEDFLFIPCFPGLIEPSTDDGQTGYKKERCPECGELMWTTDIKRDMKKKNPDSVLACMICCVNLWNRKVGEGDEMHYVGI